MPELLLELFSEEIPARMQGRAAEDLARLMTERLKAEGLDAKSVQSFAGPRRLALVMEDLPARQPDRREEKKGPRVDAPAQAVDGFLRSVGLTREQVETRKDPKGDYLFAVIERRGAPAAEVAARIVPEIVSGFPLAEIHAPGRGRSALGAAAAFGALSLRRQGRAHRDRRH